ncbi:MAG: DNA repair protein RecN [Clostridia bacterium]|nr:DNA repair protein RecN [Clostridia bacterium]
MIKSLRLKNIALIKSAEIDFENGLNVLSGETGAGKTVIISALNFALGAKADKTMIRFGETEAVAEILVDITGNLSAKSVLDEIGIDFDDEIIIRRRLTDAGKSDIRINGVAVTLSMLKQVTQEFCDVYGQSEHYSLLKQSSQLKVLDSYIGEELSELKEACKPLIADIKKCKEELESFGGNKAEREVRIEILSYQINEIETAELVDGEEDELIARRKYFANIEKIGEALQSAKALLSEDNASLDLVNLTINKIESISSFGEEFASLTDRLYNLKAELDDVAVTVENSLDNLDFDGAEFERVESRLDLIKSLKRKYGNTYFDIMEYYSKSKIELENLQNFEERSTSLENEISTKTQALKKLQNSITKLRKEKALLFEDAIKQELKVLGMKSADFKVSVSSNEGVVLSSNGVDEVEFLFSANAGEPLKTMSKIISGGEMSRFMLAMKLVSSDFYDGSTYVFDEIDAGISGSVAQTVAEKFAVISKKMQVITISHLAQIVSFSDKSYLISKTDDGERTYTDVLSLDDNGKTDEIIRITGGTIDNEISISHAKQMINLANETKIKLRS